MTVQNEMQLEFLSLAENESFARVAVSAFVLRANPTVEEVADIKTAVSEAVTNAIVHGYRDSDGMVTIRAQLTCDNMLFLEISDSGCGIEDIDLALQPFYTTDAQHERSGMGFTLMRTFMDNMHVQSKPGMGTVVYLEKKLRGSAQERISS